MKLIKIKNLLRILPFSIVLILLSSCSSNNLNKGDSLSISLGQLKNRVTKLEAQMNAKNKIYSQEKIKSITFRIGTKDDRLRIYWSDGRKIDLPCTKEQSIWVCG